MFDIDPDSATAHTGSPTPSTSTPLLVVISCAMALKLLSDPANPIRRWAVGWWGG